MILSTALTLALAGLQQQPLPLWETDRHREPTRLVLKNLDWDTRNGEPPVPAGLAYGPDEAAGAGYYLVQARGPEAWYSLEDLVLASGGVFIEYQPHNAMAVRLPEAAVAGVAAEAQALYPFHPAWKLDPILGAYGTRADDPQGRHFLSVSFWPDRDLYAEAEAVAALGVEVLNLYDTGRYLRADVRAGNRQVLEMARLPGVKWITENAIATPRNNQSRWVIQTNILNDVKFWLAGITGVNVTIGHIDGRIAESSCYFDDPTGVAPGPQHRKIKWWSSGSGQDSHGTHTAGSAAGDREPVNGSIDGNGMAPHAWLVHQSGFPSSSQLGNWLQTAHNQGARIHTNSWGDDFTTAYNQWCADIDAYMHDNQNGLVCFAATNGSSLKNPENAKSVVAVIATSSSNVENHGSGGKGPTADGRHKPEVMAPGCSTWSASTGSCSTVSMCGTSMACPVVAGGAALVKQYFEDGYYPSGSANAADSLSPTGSLIRAVLANSTDDMDGMAGWPSYSEGWGRILLDNTLFLAGDNQGLWVQDVRHNSGLSTGQTHTYTVNVPAGSSRIRFTMCFSDEPGAVNSSAPVVNNLNLKITAPNGTWYHGNLLNTNDGAARANPGGNRFDRRNTMENVIVYNPPAGNWTVEVIGADVPVGPQGYAVIATW